jgi:tetratricopeptide (TPR) repeat protein
MKKLLFALLILPIFGFSQACQYGSSTDASELCDFFRGNNFTTNKNADIALNKILSVTGMSKRFVLKECNDISNCLATSYKGIRYILYDIEFMDAIATNTNSWSSMSILAHEIGHHINGHSLDLIVYATGAAEAPSLAESRQMELEADEYSGFVMYKLGASLYQAQEAVAFIADNKDDSYSTHPAKDKRLVAIEKGYNNAKSQGANSNTATQSFQVTAEDYFYLAYNNESEYQYQIDNYTKCLELVSDYPYAYFNRGNVYAKLKNYNAAISDWTNAIRIDPDYAQAYYNRGLAYAKLKNYNAAIADYSSAIRIDPDYADAYYNRGNANSHSYPRDYIAAIADYSNAIRINPDDAEAYKMRGRIKEIIGANNYCSDYKIACDLGNEESCEWYYKQCK